MNMIESTECTWVGKSHELQRGEYIEIPGYVREFRRY